MTDYKPRIHGRLTHQPQEKQTGKLLATMHAPMICQLMYLSYGSEIDVLK